jgi:hypothetical protein
MFCDQMHPPFDAHNVMVQSQTFVIPVITFYLRMIYFWSLYFNILKRQILVLLIFNLCFREETESGDSETRDSFSDSYSDDSECDKLWTSSEEEAFEQDSLWHFNNRLGHLYFQHFEKSTPYGRVPLMDKVISKMRYKVCSKLYLNKK